MFTLLISAGVTVAVVIACAAAQMKTGATVSLSIVSFLASYYLIVFLVRKKITAVQGELQDIMKTGQERIGRKVQQAQMKPGANVKLLQRQIEGDQKLIYKEALHFTDRLEPFKKWNFLMGRQIATMRLQFLYQLKEF